MTAKNDEYNLELYKSLRAELAVYMEKVPGLWLQKFILIGAVIAFLIGKSEEVAKVNAGNRIIIAAILALPLLAMLIDAKMLEYGLHARAISKFIMISFPTPPALSNWETSLWGGGFNEEIKVLVRFRSMTTVVVIVIPTAILIILSGIIVGEITDANVFWLSLMGIITVAYVGLNYYVWRRVWQAYKD